MWLLDVEAILDREDDIRGFNAEIEVLKWHNDKSAGYAILSRRWGTEVTYDEITGLTAMKSRRRDSVRQRDGYQKIIKSCEQAKQDGYKWMWFDTCCIDKRSSAELSEAINSMYRWYRNAQKCYVYLNDVVESIFPTEQDFRRFGKSNGWPEWFSRGWTLQELIAPTEVVFFNHRWVSIGTKRDLTSSLEVITRIPEMVLKYEQVLRSTSRCPSVAHIMSWAAHRKTSRVEDRAYSLMGLLGVNMPMLYEEGSKAFQRLQLEIIRASSDYSIFAWNLKGQFLEHGSVLADDPSCFRGCTDVEKVAPSGFTKELEQYMRQDGLFLSKDASKLGSSQSNVDFPQLSRWDVTNVGIQVWLPIIPHRGSSYLKAILPCRDRYGNLIAIDFEFRGLNFARSLHPVAIRNMWPQFKSLYLDCSQDAEENHRLCLHDGQASYGFTRCGTFPCEVVGNTITLSTHGNNLVVLLYANDDARSRFAIGLGYHLGRVWARIVCDEYPAKQEVLSPWEDFAQQAYDILWDAPIEESQHSNFHSTPVAIKDTHLPQSIWHARVVYDDSGSGYTNVMVDIQQCSGCCAEPRECTYRSRRDKLWLPWTSQTVASHELELDGRPAWLDECSSQEIILGDYGDFRPNGRFKRHGNIFEDMRELDIHLTDSVYRPVVSRVSSCRHILHRTQNQHEIVTTSGFWIPLELHQPKGLPLPSNKESELLLKALSTRFSGKRLVKTVIECSQVYTVDREGRRKALGGDGNRSAAPGILTPLCIIATPLAWSKGPASTQRRERFQSIREHFYASANLHDLVGNESRQKSTINGAVDFSAMFGLEYLENYVGEITFFERLRSIMESSLVSKGSAGNGLPVHTPNPSFA
ncbi:hypothetical protein EV401DRAFT_1365195 [Pisolithus croceorrhizus]|nr:hypothetical protein EV401DRAFT_1365195 [Pisolithus croceorrhizus]